MAGRDIDYDKWAEILLDAALEADSTVAQQWGVSRQQISRWRRSYREGEPNICEAVRRKEYEREHRWVRQIPGALESVIAFLQRAANQSDPTDPDAVREAARALQQLHETKLTHDVMQHRLQQDEPRRIEQLE